MFKLIIASIILLISGGFIFLVLKDLVFTRKIKILVSFYDNLAKIYVLIALFFPNVIVISSTSEVKTQLSFLVICYSLVLFLNLIIMLRSKLLFNAKQ